METIFNILPRIEEREYKFDPLPVGVNPYDSILKFEINIRRIRLDEIETKLKTLDLKKESDKDQVRWFISKYKKIKLSKVHMDDINQIEGELMDKLHAEKNHIMLELLKIDHSYTPPVEWKSPIKSSRVVLPRHVYENIKNNKVFLQNLKDNYNCKVTLKDLNQLQYLQINSTKQEAIDQVKQSINAFVSSFETKNKIKNLKYEINHSDSKTVSRFQKYFYLDEFPQNNPSNLNKDKNVVLTDYINTKYNNSKEKFLNLEFKNSSVKNEPNKILSSVEMEITGKNIIMKDQNNEQMSQNYKNQEDHVQNGIRWMVSKINDNE